MRVVLVGEDSAGIQTLRHLAQTRHSIIGVLAKPDNRSGSSSLWKVAQSMGHSPRPASQVRDAAFGDWIANEKADVLLNVHSLELVSDAVLTAPTWGSYNLHPGPLPRYAGLNSVCWAIYNGETSHGVTLHRMAPVVDAGAIVSQALVPITPEETGLTLASKCVKAGLPLVFDLLDRLSTAPHDLPSIPQDLAQRTFFPAACPHGGRIDWSAPAERIVNFVRAADFVPFPSPWGHPRTSIDGRDVGIAKVTRTGRSCIEVPGTSRVEAGTVLVASQDEWIQLKLLQVDSRYVAAETILHDGTQLDRRAEV